MSLSAFANSCVRASETLEIAACRGLLQPSAERVQRCCDMRAVSVVSTFFAAAAVVEAHMPLHHSQSVGCITVAHLTRQRNAYGFSVLVANRKGNRGWNNGWTTDSLIDEVVVAGWQSNTRLLQHTAKSRVLCA
jgi:hypothetical protein